MLGRLIGFLIFLACSHHVMAKPDLDCLDKQTACSNGCIAKQDMACLERCLAAGQACVEKESQASSATAGETSDETSDSNKSASSGTNSGTNSSTNLQGCWRSDEKLTTWCFTGTTSEITTDSYSAAGGKRITGLNRVTLSGSSMSYYIVRAAMTGPGAYDNATNKGPYTQAYTYSNTKIPSFYAAGDRYVKQ